MVQTDRLPKLELPVEVAAVPELIADDSSPDVLPEVRLTDEIGSDEPTAEV
jgi:hypothetical protein